MWTKRFNFYKTKAQNLLNKHLLSLIYCCVLFRIKTPTCLLLRDMTKPSAAVNGARPQPTNHLLPTLPVPPPAPSPLQIWTRPRQPQLTVTLILKWEDIICVWFYEIKSMVDSCFHVKHLRDKTSDSRCLSIKETVLCSQTLSMTPLPTLQPAPSSLNSRSCSPTLEEERQRPKDADPSLVRSPEILRPLSQCTYTHIPIYLFERSTTLIPKVLNAV